MSSVYGEYFKQLLSSTTPRASPEDDSLQEGNNIESVHIVNDCMKSLPTSESLTNASSRAGGLSSSLTRKDRYRQRQRKEQLDTINEIAPPSLSWKRNHVFYSPPLVCRWESEPSDKTLAAARRWKNELSHKTNNGDTHLRANTRDSLNNNGNCDQVSYLQHQKIVNKDTYKEINKQDLMHLKLRNSGAVNNMTTFDSSFRASTNSPTSVSPPSPSTKMQRRRQRAQHLRPRMASMWKENHVCCYPPPKTCRWESEPSPKINQSCHLKDRNYQAGLSYSTRHADCKEGNNGSHVDEDTHFMPRQHGDKSASNDTNTPEEDGNDNNYNVAVCTWHRERQRSHDSTLREVSRNYMDDTAVNTMLTSERSKQPQIDGNCSIDNGENDMDQKILHPRKSPILVSKNNINDGVNDDSRDSKLKPLYNSNNKGKASKSSTSSENKLCRPRRKRSNDNMHIVHYSSIRLSPGARVH